MLARIVLSMDGGSVVFRMGKITRMPIQTGEPACFVRVTNHDHRGFVEFQFSIGDPSLYLDMTLPPAAFAEFCAEHRTRVLSSSEGAAVDAGERRWRFGDDEEE